MILIAQGVRAWFLLFVPGEANGVSQQFLTTNASAAAISEDLAKDRH